MTEREALEAKIKHLEEQLVAADAALEGDLKRADQLSPGTLRVCRGRHDIFRMAGADDELGRSLLSAYTTPLPPPEPVAPPPAPTQQASSGLYTGVFAGASPRLHGVREWRPAVLWDSILLKDHAKEYTGWFCTRERLGQPVRCNLQLPGSLASDSTFVFTHWWFETIPYVPRLRGVATLVLGDKPQIQMLISTLEYGVPLRIILPVRQNFNVQTAFVDVPKGIPDDTLAYIHFAGWITRPVS